jgi:uncharacterized protein YjiS (DUF1127 family)
MNPAMTHAATPAAARARAVQATVAAAGVLRTIWRAVAHRLAVKPLLEMDERMLQDIGLARGDVYDALSTGLASDPSSRLASTAARHASAERARLRNGLRSDALVRQAAAAPPKGPAGAAPGRSLAA